MTLALSESPPFDLLLLSLFLLPPSGCNLHPLSRPPSPSAGSGCPGLQASQQVPITESFNAAAISSPLMSSEGGASPHPQSGESEPGREGGRFGEEEVHSISTTVVCFHAVTWEAAALACVLWKSDNHHTGVTGRLIWGYLWEHRLKW